LKSENAAFLFGRQRFLWRGGELGVFTLIRHASRATFPREGEGLDAVGKENLSRGRPSVAR